MEDLSNAPTQEIENEIVNFCLNELKIPFGDFWYEWFSSNKKDNFNLRIKTVNKIDINREQLLRLTFIKTIFKITNLDLAEIFCMQDDIRYICNIHFSSIEKKVK